MTPYEGLDSPVVLVAWEHRLEVPSINDPRVQQFVDAYAGQFVGARAHGGRVQV